MDDGHDYTANRTDQETWRTDEYGNQKEHHFKECQHRTQYHDARGHFA